MSTGALAIASFIISVVTFIVNMLWTPFQRGRADSVRLSLDFRQEYAANMQPHLDVIYSYTAEHGPACYRHWQLAMQPGLQADNIEKKIDTARRLLAAYWDELLECYDTGALPRPPWAPRWLLRGPLWVPKDMMSGNFLRKAENYMRLVEPFDCANWYRLGIHNELDRDGQQKGHYTHANRFRPGRYSKIESHMARADRQAWHVRLDGIAAACNQTAAQPLAPLDIAGDENGV